MKLHVILLIGIMYCGNNYAQTDANRSVFISLTPTAGIFQSKIIDVIGSPPFNPDDIFTGPELGLTSRIMWHLKSMNVGVGLRLNKRIKKTAKELEFYNYNTTTPSIFGSIEFGNATELEQLSFVFNSGIIKGTVDKKYKLFISGGPKFNIGKHHKKVNISIHPSVLFHLSETIEKGGVDYRLGYPVSYTYDAVFRTFQVNLGVVIEFNKFADKTELNE